MLNLNGNPNKEQLPYEQPESEQGDHDEDPDYESPDEPGSPYGEPN